MRTKDEFRRAVEAMGYGVVSVRARAGGRPGWRAFCYRSAEGGPRVNFWEGLPGSLSATGYSTETGREVAVVSVLDVTAAAAA